MVSSHILWDNNESVAQLQDPWYSWEGGWEYRKRNKGMRNGFSIDQRKFDYLSWITAYWKTGSQYFVSLCTFWYICHALISIITSRYSRIFLVSRPGLLSALFRAWVPLAWQLSFRVLAAAQESRCISDSKTGPNTVQTRALSQIIAILHSPSSTFAIILQTCVSSIINFKHQSHR